LRTRDQRCLAPETRPATPWLARLVFLLVFSLVFEKILQFLD